MLPSTRYNANKDRRSKVSQVPSKVSEWYENLPASQNPWATPQCMGLMLAAQVAGILLHFVLLMYWGRVTEVVTVEVAASPEIYRTVISVGVITRVSKDGSVEILTQKYSPESAVQDPLFAGRWEAVGSKLGLKETPLLAMKRQVKEQFDMSDEDIRKMSVAGMTKGDVEYQYTASSNGTGVASHLDKWFVLHNPFMYVQSLQGTKPWAAIGMVIVMPHELSLRMRSRDGDKWWRPEDLHRETLSQSQTFAGMHYPILQRVSGDIRSGQLQLSTDDEARGLGALAVIAFRYDGLFDTERDPDRKPKVISRGVNA